MQGGTLLLVIAAPAAAMATYLYVTSNTANVAHQRAVETRIERDKAEFDRDFAQSWSKQASPELERRAVAANLAVEKQEKADAQAQATQEAQAQELRGQLSEAFGKTKSREQSK